MNEKKIKNIYIKSSIITLIIVISVICVMTGCNGYKTFILKNSLANCSFEYPSSFPPPYVDKTGSGNSTSIMTKRIIKKPTSGFINYSIFISLIKSDSNFPDVHSLIEDDLRVAQRGQSIGEFELIDRSSITIAGLVGEQVIYRYSAQILDTDIRTTDISYNAYFEKNDILWTINLNSSLEMTSQVKMDFDQIIRSFKLF